VAHMQQMRIHTVKHTKTKVARHLLRPAPAFMYRTQARNETQRTRGSNANQGLVKNLGEVNPPPPG